MSHSNQPSHEVFQNPSGEPLKFHLVESETPLDLQIAIEANGGQLLPHYNVKDPSADPSVILLASSIDSITGELLLRPVYNILFVRDCINAKMCLDLKSYLMKREDDLSAVAAVNAPPRRASRQSMTKGKFTPEEDDLILNAVRRNPWRRSTHRLYDEIAMMLGTRTGNSVRFRFRDHLSAKLDWVYKTDPVTNELVHDNEGNLIKVTDLPKTIKTKFTALDDYNLCKELLPNIKTIDEHGKERVSTSKEFFDRLGSTYPSHTPNAWRDRFRKFAVEYGINNYIQYYETEVANKRVPDAMKNFTSKDNSDRNNRRRNTAVSEAAVAAVAVANQHMKRGAPEDLFTEDDKKLKMPDLHAHQIDDSVNFFANQDHVPEDETFNIYHSAALPISLDVLNKYTKEEFMAKIDEITTSLRDEDLNPQTLTNNFCEKLGFSASYVEQLIGSCNGDLQFMKLAIENYLKTGGKQLIPENVAGIWSVEDDEKLRAGHEDVLVEKHGKKSVKRRKAIFGLE